MNETAIALASDFYKFFRWSWPILSKEEFIPNWHIEYIARRLHKIGLSIIKRERPEYLKYLFNVPPGSTKSSLISQSWPVWLWTLDPTIKILNCAYADDASLKNSFFAKAIIKSDDFRVVFQPYFKAGYGRELELIRDLTDDWHNNFGGQYYATTTTGQATSMHFHLLIFDDPQNAAIADSDTKRKASNRLHDLTFPSRKINKDITPSVYVMQRFNMEDTIGHEMAKTEEYYHCCLPAELTEHVYPAELRERYTDGLLDPVRGSRAILEKQKDSLGSFGYAGQYLQWPFPDGGGLVKKEWFVIIEENEAPQNVVWDLWIDGAYTENKANDPTGFMFTGYDPANNTLTVKFAESRWMTTPDVIAHTKDLMADFGGPASMIFIEPKASGYSFIQLLLQETLFNVTRITGRLVRDGKAARINYAAPKIQSSRVRLVRGNWNDEFITQHVAFPNYSHDEFSDLLGYAVKHYFG